MSMDAETLDREGLVWVENLSPIQSNFTHQLTGLTVRWAPQGQAESVQAVPRRVADDPIRRAVQRGLLGKLSEAEAEDRLATVIAPGRAGEMMERSRQHIMDALAVDASEKLGQHFTKEGLSEWAVQSPDITPEEVWGTKEAPAKEATASREPAPTRNLGPDESGVAPGPDDIEGPLPPEQVLTAPERQEGT